MFYFEEALLGDMTDHQDGFLILNPLWIIAAFNRFIDGNCGSQNNIVTQKMWKRYRQCGELARPLVDDLWRDDLFIQHKDRLLVVMEDLGLIAKPKIGEKEQIEYIYFVPGVMTEVDLKDLYDFLDDKKEHIVCSKTLCLMYRYIPFTVFHKLLAVLVTTYKLASYIGGKLQSLQKGLGCFLIEDNLHLVVYCTTFTLHMKVFRYAPHTTPTINTLGDQSLVTIRQYIELIISNITKKMCIQDLTFKYFLQSDLLCKHRGIAIGDFKDDYSIFCCERSSALNLTADDLKPWFDQT